ncbi:PerC family transcriptional regulator [Kluyvera sp. CHPC 1.2972]|uniref:PerC family transcriptional regulator n=1 Tax=Kluyvera sp. CHPC 1.2972 TaxID=2995176 RepID=UPI002FD85D8A
MVDKFERQKAVAHYLLENPQASPVQISEALCLTDRATRYIIGVMTERGMILRTRNAVDGRIHNFIVSDWYASELIDGPAPAALGKDRQLEATANQLESRGLWRRAATVWAELSRLQKTVTGVATIASRRNRCIRLGRA